MTNSISVRKITWKYLAIILLISVLGLLLFARMGWHAIEEDKRRHHAFETKVLQTQFSELIGFYQGIARQLSERADVIDIVQFGDREQAMVWAKNVRLLIPESIGVALIDAEGEVMGEPLQLNLGAQCVNDLTMLFAGRQVGSPPVHRLNPELEHFDITQEVVYQGEVIGVLFISFRLDVIKERASKLVNEGQTLIIEDSLEVPIAIFGASDHSAHHTDEHKWVNITGTGWHLHYMAEEHGANALFSTTFLLVGLFLVVAIGVMLVLSMRIISLFTKDLALIKEQLSGVYAGCRNELPLERVVLSETCDIMDDVWAVMSNIEQANHQLKEMSVNDELSGLLNRRGFNEKLEQHWELSSRGVSSSLVLLDLDHFKQVNDTFGHGAGDEVIKALAQALTERCRKTDIIARLGGDEFAVILNSTTQQQGLQQWYDELATRFVELQQGLINQNEARHCTISAGAVLLDKGHYDWLQKQIDAADRALYRAKGQGRGRLVTAMSTIRLGS